MRTRTWITLMLLLLAGLAAAQEKGKAEPAPDPAMEAWMKASTPGEAHKLLARHVGEWDAEVRTWMDPAAPPMVSKGKGSNTLIFGGRFVETRFRGDFMGRPFEGIGYMGYDNVGKKYVSFWIDNTSTWFMTSTGTADKEGKVWNNTGEVADPMTGRTKAFREEAVFETPDRLVSRTYEKGPGGKQTRTMEITYTRVK